MKRLFFALFVVVTVVTGCSSSRPWYEGRRDPVVGRTTDGHRIYEDRSGRLYTLDRYGRRIYRDGGYIYDEGSRKYKVKKTNRSYGRGRGNTQDHPGRGHARGHDKDKHGHD